MTLKIYNTLSAQKEIFKPLKANYVGMYSCGPTVYDYAHIGNLRAYTFADLLRRYLEYKGYKVKHVMNITDLDDKTINKAKKEGVSLKEYTERYAKLFFEDIELLNLKKAHVYPRVTEHIKEMVEMIKILIEKGYAYRKNGSIYYKISNFKEYGNLSKIDLSKVEIGASVDADEYEKEDVRDFALWKAKREGEPFWKTEIGEGRPGWHIECSAMSTKYLGPTLDIHTGGVDNIFPHHENTIAQSEASTGKPFVRYWMHCEHLLVNNKKMSKSLGNIYTLRDLLKKGYNAKALRMVFISTHYRSKLNFTEKSMQSAANTLKKLNLFVERIRDFKSDAKDNEEIQEIINKTEKKFEEALDDDLNTPKALAAIFETIRKVNQAMNLNKISTTNARNIYKVMLKLDQVFGVLTIEEKGELPSEIELLIKEREEARKNKNFKKADEIRNKLINIGIILEDTKEGVKWRRK
ncbi:MAG: cysteine--tRNA ligase [Methanosarcinales archaeon]